MEIAAEAYRRALALKPDLVEAWHNLGLTLRALGRTDEAAEALGNALTIRPGQVETYVSLGLVRLDEGRRADAVASFERAVSIQPRHIAAWMNLGNVRHLQGDLTEAAAAYQRVLALHPDFPDAHANLGAVLKDQGDLAGAAASLWRALALKPGLAAAWYTLGAVLAGQGAMPEAEQAYERAIALRPEVSEAHTNLANLHLGQGRLEAAEQGYRRVVALRPNSADAHMNLAKALQAQGRLVEAMDLFEQAAALAPDHPEARDAWLCGLSYRADVSAEAILAEHRRFSSPAATPRTYPNVRDPDRRLRIGYVSGDLRRHPVGWFLSPVLAAHDPAHVEVFCYSNDERSDAVTVRMRGAAHHWRLIAGRSDEAAAGQVAQDRVDILVDLSGRTPGSRSGLFDLRPAPVQASWLGYASTTGRQSIDYLLMDPWTAPAGAEAWCSEALVRLPFGRFCYGPPAEAPEPSPPPSLARGHVTFGSFNNLAKIGPETARLWASVLAATPGSRLLLKWTALDDPGVRRRIGALFAQAGVAEGALELRGYSPHPEMLAQYGEMDVALDPFPFGGGLTSCEALWMGVPVVTWPQDRFASRQTLGFLATVGLDDLPAGSAEAYVATAVALAADVERRADLRSSLRLRMSRSPLCDAQAFTPSLEAAYRRMWRGWCADAAPAAFDFTSAEAGPRSPAQRPPPARA
jgi:predicted O-linked N-acetylglucosamine transferase (SPINDLY family)